MQLAVYAADRAVALLQIFPNAPGNSNSDTSPDRWCPDECRTAESPGSKRTSNRSVTRTRGNTASKTLEPRYWLNQARTTVSVCERNLGLRKHGVRMRFPAETLLEDPVILRAVVGKLRDGRRVLTEPLLRGPAPHVEHGFQPVLLAGGQNSLEGPLLGIAGLRPGRWHRGKIRIVQRDVFLPRRGAAVFGPVRHDRAGRAR